MSNAPRPAPRKPVGWLVGLELLRKLKSIAVYAAFGDRMDHKDWMSGTLFWFRPPGDPAVPPAQPPGAVETIATAADELWFDYIADCGDGQTAMHNVACLCLSDADLDGADAVTLRPPGAPPPPASARRLPRGAFLLVGGDTAYHVADVPTLTERFHQPFAWAVEDLSWRGWPAPDERPLFGIPGNHDYYDALHGFNQQFRRELPQVDPTRPSGKPPNPPAPRLALGGFRRLQQSSFFALRLPHDWWLWGLDTQEGHLDIRQQQFFLGTCAGAPPRRLIVTTPEPVIALGAPVQDASPLARSFAALMLPRPFLGLEQQRTAASRETLPPDTVRLDLAGDFHHYERYGANAARPAYAAVVAGTGGAFMHPTHTRLGKATPDAQDPTPADSRALIAGRVLNPIEIAAGGYVYLAGALIGGLVLAGAGVADSFRRFLGWALGGLPAADLRPRTGGWDAVATALDLPSSTRLPAPGIAVVTAVLLAILVVLGFSRLGLTSPDRKVRRQRFALVTWAALVVTLVALGALGWIADSAEPAVSVADAPAYLPFLASAIVVLSLLAAPALLTWMAQYRVVRGEVRHNHAIRNAVKVGDAASSVALAAGTLAAFAAVLVVHVRFARLPGIVLLVDGLLLSIVLLCLVGLPLLALFGNERLPRGQRTLLLVPGIAHAVGQVGAPFLVVAFGAWWVALAWALGYALLAAGARALARKGARLPIAAAWLVWIALPVFLVVCYPSAAEPFAWPRLALACALGAVASCAVLGSYLWTSTLLGGHCNEAGGAARLEAHRQILRCHVSAAGLEVFVLGVDRPAMAGPVGPGTATPPTGPVRLVDRFTLPAL